jgi:hypothetical protein
VQYHNKIKSPFAAALGFVLVFAAISMLIVHPVTADEACGAWNDGEGYSGYSCCHDGSLNFGSGDVRYTGGQALAAMSEGGNSMLRSFCSAATPPTCTQKCGFSYSAASVNSFVGDTCLFATHGFGQNGVSTPSAGQCAVCGWAFWEASVVNPCVAGAANTSPDVTPTPTPTPPIIPTFTPMPSPSGNGGSGGTVPIVPVIKKIGGVDAVGTISTLSPNYTKMVDRLAYENYLSNGTLSVLTAPFLSLWDSIGNTVQNFFLTVENILLIPFSYIASNVGIVTTDIHNAVDSIAASLKYFITLISTSLNSIPDIWKAIISVCLGLDVAYTILKGRTGNS